jgi:hypothetical protein
MLWRCAYFYIGFLCYRVRLGTRGGLYQPGAHRGRNGRKPSPRITLGLGHFESTGMPSFRLLLGLGPPPAPRALARRSTRMWGGVTNPVFFCRLGAPTTPGDSRHAHPGPGTPHTRVAIGACRIPWNRTKPSHPDLDRLACSGQLHLHGGEGAAAARSGLCGRGGQAALYRYHKACVVIPAKKKACVLIRRRDAAAFP